MWLLPRLVCAKWNGPAIETDFAVARAVATIIDGDRAVYA